MNKPLPNTFYYPYYTDLCEQATQTLVELEKQNFPFLDDVVFLVAHHSCTSALRQTISRHLSTLGYSTILGPQIMTLKDFIEKNNNSDLQRTNSLTHQFILIQALQSQSHLFSKQNLFTLSQALLTLFEELTIGQVDVETDYAKFLERIKEAYQNKLKNSHALEREAKIVYTLWHAWHQQLHDNNLIDPNAYYQLALNQQASKHYKQKLYVIGLTNLIPAEEFWLTSQLEKNHCYLFAHDNAVEQQFNKTKRPNTNILAKNDFFETVFATEKDQIKRRVLNQKSHSQHSPVEKHINIFNCNSFEEEANSIDIQVRLWLQEKKSNIALVIEDRRLARRVRAILARSGVGLVDPTGWALSTSTAASSIENWLLCIEENFHYVPFLDFLKSPYVFSKADTHTHAVHRLEQDIIHHENIANDLTRFISACELRNKKLNSFNNSTTQYLIDLLQRVREISLPLYKLQNDKLKPLSSYITCLSDSIKQLGIEEKYAIDEAGQAILTLLESIKNSSEKYDISLSWNQFRNWLSSQLESSTFSATNQFKHSVKLFHLSNYAISNFDGVIIANLTRDFYPGSIPANPFFNQSVRHELGLKTFEQNSNVNLHHFRRLLESSDQVLLSCHVSDEKNIMSPWLELIQNFHSLAYNNNLQNVDFSIYHETTRNNEQNMSATDYSASIPPTLFPNTLSASNHQNLINCPYAFFASKILTLSATEEAREKLAKSDYGERVHECLSVFHESRKQKYPSLEQSVVTQHNKQEAINELMDISQQIFLKDLEDNFQHRGWLKRWKQTIPNYIDWLETHNLEWNFYLSEQAQSNEVFPGLALHGRLDRIDISRHKKNQEKLIIDYKTGSTPTKIDVESGEAIQLIHYASTFNPLPQQIFYLALDEKEGKTAEKCTYANDELKEFSEKSIKRLHDIKSLIHSGTKLPSWGEDNFCTYCQFSGLCRKHLRENQQEYEQ